ncbi:MAG: hypothetical protein COX81_03085 [Candidatus Magasanikbacteria bacterium CG_4_10_14_0_2_um_filter_37_12]|uniref:Reverse transcriptase domain-containing protein n=1 Tax=Candidatus Magasanikbacteria bacterium CG_4_10_14_0_2_um_filter_37_12 TaxID=1974637 RepID=A0A2M7V7A5_9BACT|nr:MAG: hypothetical protein COX81_03085 [Candidatus Magasanikbacteria bacterium CG_4_10_14_0_2_um_filter_37_12]
MPLEKRYPTINLRSKNEIAKRITDNKLPFKESIKLLNRVINNHSELWHDVISFSEPSKGKYVRSAKNTPLGKLLSLFDKKILRPHDKLIPKFIFGGVSGGSHVQASYHLLGICKKRTKLGLDITKFFEHNSEQRVFYFFHKKCNCSVQASKILSKLCCVPLGAKGSNNSKTLARGFATSTRLAVWCNLDLFLRIYWEAKKTLKYKDVKIAVFIDDIGISASRVDKRTMEDLSLKIRDILENYDKNQCLPLNNKKTEVKSYLDGEIEHLGLILGNKKLSFGRKTRKKLSDLKKDLDNKQIKGKQRKSLYTAKKSYYSYKKYIKNPIDDKK